MRYYKVVLPSFKENWNKNYSQQFVACVIFIMEFSPKKPVKSRKNCCVIGCKSIAKNNRGIRFHKFPRKGEKRVMVQSKMGYNILCDKLAAWKKAVKINKINVHMTVCSLHFKSGDYKSNSNVRNKLKRYLKPDAVPSCNLPSTPRHGTSTESPSSKERRQKIREERYVKRQLFVETVITPGTSSSMLDMPGTSDSMLREHYEDQDAIVEHNPLMCPESSSALTESPSRLSAAEILLELANSCPVVKVYIDKATQVKSGDISIPFIFSIENDSILRSLTCIPNFKVLDHLSNLIKKYYPVKRRHHLSVKEEIILTFMKLKLDISFTVLTILFHFVSLDTCRRTFYSFVRKLASILRPLIRWVDKKEIRNNMPLCFDIFPNVVVVLDCTECAVQKPKCLKCRIKCYSHYKSQLTVKFMTGVTPGGLLSFCSKAYGGRASDKKIFEQSNIIDLLQINDEIMVDRGFLVDDVCAFKKIKVIRPPFLRNKKQFSKSEALHSKQIARARVHVERVNQRIKTFKILSNNLEWGMMSYIDDIFIMICGIVNLSAPVLADDKFF